MHRATVFVCGSLLAMFACTPGNNDQGSNASAEGGAATTGTDNVSRGGSSDRGDSNGGANGGASHALGGSVSLSASLAFGGTETAPTSGRGGAASTASSTITAGNGGTSGGSGTAPTSVRGGAASTASSTVTAGSSSTSVGSCGESSGQLFGKDHPFNQRIDTAPLDAESAGIISFLKQNHTASQRFRVDGPSDEPDNQYGITILSAEASTVRQSFTPTGDFFSPDCDPAPIPIPSKGAIEGEDSYACTNDGDCHLIVIDRAACRLYEMWRANRSSATSFEGGCGAVWDLREKYSPELRGDCCTSADAAGLPIAAQMFGADEIASGRIEHAIRFIMPNNLIRKHIYVRPATHSTGPTSGSALAPPYGARVRLKGSFDDSKLKPAARVVAKALKEYGMILSDGGNLTFTATNDRFTQHKWKDVDFTASDLTSLQWSDFEVPELGTRYTFDDNCNCERIPISR